MLIPTKQLRIFKKKIMKRNEDEGIVVLPDWKLVVALSTLSNLFNIVSFCITLIINGSFDFIIPPKGIGR